MKFSLFCSSVSLVNIFLSLDYVDAFLPSNGYSSKSSVVRAPVILGAAGEPIEMEVGIPPSSSGLKAQMRIPPILPNSEMIEVRYGIPFGLNVEPRDGLAICTKDGAGGEKEGDVLRYTSAWTMGLPRGDGILSTAASFSGGIGWQCSLFNVAKANSWPEVIEALTSNVPARTDEVVLLFERPLPVE